MEQQPSVPSAAPPPLPNYEITEVACPTEYMLTTYSAPYSHASEEYRKLKEAVIKEAGREGFNNVLLITSPNPGEGKTVTTLNLAISLAQEFDFTVLVVDADLRAPSCHKYLGLNPGPGLSGCLAGDSSCQDALIRTGIGRLVLLPAGEPVPNPVELLSSKRMKQLIQELKHRYPDRFILIDSPPVNLFAETRFLASMADTSILVVREGETSLTSIETAAQALDNRVMGIVYNDAQVARFGNQSHYDQYKCTQADEAGQ